MSSYCDELVIDIALEIAQAAPTVTTPTAITGLKYNGREQALIEAGSATGGTMVYSLNGTDYAEDIPTATNADTYTVYYKVNGDANHSDTTASVIEVTIDKATPNIDPTPAAKTQAKHRNS